MEAFIRRQELADLLDRLDGPDLRGVVVQGSPGIGKTVLLRQLEAELRQQGRPVLTIRLLSVSSVDELMYSIVSAMEAEVPDIDVERIFHSSAGTSALLREDLLLQIAERVRAPVLLLDGLDESPDPESTAAAIDEFSRYRVLAGWQFVISTRGLFRRFAQFWILALGPLSETEMIALLRESESDLTEDQVHLVAANAHGIPLLGRIAAVSLLSGVPPLWMDPRDAVLDPDRVKEVFSHAFDLAISRSSDSSMLRAFMVELAIAGGRDRISVLAGNLQIPEIRVQKMADNLSQRGLLAFDQSAATIVYFHDLVQEFVLSRWVFSRPFRLDELKFGREEAERDDLFEASFVERPGPDRILKQRRSIVIGDRGSGKSAIFRRLADEQSVEVLPVANSGDLLHLIVDKDSWVDADALRAAWLSAIAAITAGAVPDEAPKNLRRNADDLRIAFGLPTKPPGLIRRAVRMAARLFGGATLKFGVGPVNFEANLPVGTRPSGSFFDVESLIQEMDQVLKQVGQQVLVLFDRIDEMFKYDRDRQQAVIQALLQAEARVCQLDRIGLVVFLRTDLFELYDIQEKNKLVSRTVALEWSEQDWLRVLIQRVFANEPLSRLAHHLRLHGDDTRTRAALDVLFPAEIEGQPIDRWLIDSLRNGNGDISPRLAVLLLHLTQEHSRQLNHPVTSIPLFSIGALQRAMTKLSDLSFSELVNDFKVAPTFVLNCRAGKITTFTLSDAEDLFDNTEGKISEQVRLLERLGFLERIVEQRGTQTRSLFQIPRLYTRCWNHA